MNTHVFLNDEGLGPDSLLYDLAFIDLLLPFVLLVLFDRDSHVLDLQLTLHLLLYFKIVIQLLLQLAHLNQVLRPLQILLDQHRLLLDPVTVVDYQFLQLLDLAENVDPHPPVVTRRLQNPKVVT
jgi:hypothetical protein